jgi:hypothetical protein
MKRGNPFANAHQSQTSPSTIGRDQARVKPLAIVFDGDKQRVRQALEKDAAGGRLRVSDDIRQRFLDDPVGAEVDFGWKPVSHIGLNQLRANVSPVRERLQVPIERGGKPKIIESRRVQQLRKIADALDRPFGKGARLGQGRCASA